MLRRISVISGNLMVKLAYIFNLKKMIELLSCCVFSGNPFRKIA
jgi:hypothetical protein